MSADLILLNGQFHTMDSAVPLAQALAICGNRIVALGSNDQMLMWQGSDTQRVDLANHTVVPGFIDCHIHFVDWALAQQEVDLTGAATLEEAVGRVRAHAQKRTKGHWILGGRFDPNLLPGTAWPTRWDLDAATVEHPVIIITKDMHSCWVNSLALKMAGIHSATLEVSGGVIQRHSDTQEPTGILQENALALVQKVIPPLNDEEVVRVVAEGFSLAAAQGLTGIHEIWDTPGARNLRAYQRIRRDGAVRMLRVYQHLPLTHLASAIDLGMESGLGDEWLRMGGIKLFADGALGSRTALMLQAYAGDPHNLGVAAMNSEELRATITAAHAAGISVSVHAIGDAANRRVLDIFSALAEQEPAAACPKSKFRRLRHRVEHVQLLNPADLPRLAHLGLIASMQPIHATSDITIAEKHWGPQRTPLAYAWQNLLQSGTTVCFGSDAPVESFSVIRGIHAAVTRRRADGSPGPEGWIPAQRLTPQQAVYAYTQAAAFASGEETIKGSLRVGKLADAVVLSQDIFTCPPQEILETRVLATLLDGRFVYGPHL